VCEVWGMVSKVECSVRSVGVVAESEKKQRKEVQTLGVFHIGNIVYPPAHCS